MEKLQSSRPWRKKINGPAMMSRSDYDNVFGVPRWQSAPFSLRLDDYSDIFDTTSSASSIPVLDLSVAENGFETAGERSAGAGVDYFDIFGSHGGGGFAASYEELLAERKTSRGSSLEGRTLWDVLSEQKEKEASEHPLKVYTENNEPNMEKNLYSSFPGQSDDTSLKQFSTLYSKMSDKTIDNVAGVKKNWGKLDAIPGYAVSADANDPAQESKNKAINKGTFINTGTNCYTLDGGQKNDTAPYFPSTENIVLNPLKSDCTSLLDVLVDEKHNSGLLNHNPTSSGNIPLQDVAYLKVSEINLQTKPFKGPPPSRPPPELSMKPEHPKVLCADSEFNVEERSYLESEVNDQQHSSSEATKIHTINESMKDISFLYDTEMDLSSAAAVSIAAIKEAMEQAQIRLASAKKLMDRKSAKLHWKFGPPKTVSSKEDGSSYEVELNSWSKDANNLLKESNTISGSTVVEREENSTAVKIPLNHEERRIQLPSYRKDQQRVSNENASKLFLEREEISTVGKIPLDHGEIKMQIPSYIKDQQQVRKVNTSKSSQVACKIIEIAKELKEVEEYYDLPRNDKLLTTVKGMKIEGDEKNVKAAICSVEDTEKYCKDSEQAVEVEEKQRSMEANVCFEKLEKNSKLKGPSMDCMEEANKNFVDATMDAFLLKAHASELKENYGFVLPDENQKQSEALEDNNNECNAHKTGSDLQNSNIDFKPWLANGYCEEKELKFTDGVFGYEEYKSKINANHVKHELYENKEMKVPNEALFYDVFLKEIKEPEELCTFNITDKKEVEEEVKPCKNYENGTRSVNYHYSYKANRCKIEERDKAAGKDEGDEFQENEEAHILVENELEKEAIQTDNGLENSLEMPKVQEKIEDAELETILNLGKTTTCKDCNAKETREVRTALQEVEESLENFMNAAGKGEGDEFQANEEAHIFVENEPEKEAIQNDYGLENGLEMPKVQGKIKDAELETILNFGKTTTCKDCNEKETREVRTALQEVEESLEDFMNQNVNNSEFLASAEVTVLFENQISLNTADEAGQLSEIEELDSGKVFLARKEASLLAFDTTKYSYVEKAENQKHFLCTEVQKNKNKITVNRERDKDQETSLEEKELARESERGRIAMERANYEAHQQVLAEAQVRAEKIAVERATAEARQRALAEAQQKAEKAAEAEKASREARMRAERVAVERATEEARKRAIEKALAEKVAADKALAEKVAADARARTAQVSASNKESRAEHFKATPIKEDSEARHKPSFAKIHRNTQSQTAANGRIYSDSHNNGGGAESTLTSKARQERQQQTAQRSAKALPEKNMRDILAKQEQRWAESLDGEVKRWSNGKEGNLRALLSSLQYILGPDSGWQPVPLADIIDVVAAKKAYRKATLCVHPDKLQQRGASVQHKHICEKVFDLLQEAWNKFNSEAEAWNKFNSEAL